MDVCDAYLRDFKLKVRSGVMSSLALVLCDSVAINVLHGGISSTVFVVVEKIE